MKPQLERPGPSGANTSAESSTQDSLKTQVIKDAAVYIPSTYVAQLLGFINAFLIRRLLGPAMMGIWATVDIIINYGSYLHLGSFAAGAKEIPYHLGKKDRAMAERVQNNIFSFGILMASLGAVILTIASFVLAGTLPWPLRMGLIAGGLILLGRRNYNFTIMLMRSYKNFSLLSKVTIFTAVLDVVLVGTLVWAFKIYGLYLAMLASLGISTVYAFRKLSVRIHWDLNREILRGIARIGLPMFALGLVLTVLRTADKILVVKYLGTTSMGIYSIAVMGSNYVFGLSNMIGILTLPRFSENYGHKGDVALLGTYMDKTNRMLGVLLPVALGVLYFLAPFLIRFLLPKYASGIPAMEVLLLGTFFLCLIHQPHNFLLAIGKPAWILPSIIAGAGISFALNYWVVTGPKDLTYVALATSASYLVTFLILYITANQRANRTTPVWIPLAQSLIPFAYVVAVLLSLNFAFRQTTAWWAQPLKFLLFLLANAYPVWALDKETHVMRKSIGLFWEKAAAVLKARKRAA